MTAPEFAGGISPVILKHFPGVLIGFLKRGPAQLRGKLMIKKSTDHLYLVDPRGDWMLRVSADPDPAKFKRDLERLLRVSAPWDPPGR